MKRIMKGLFAALFVMLISAPYVKAQEEISDQDLYRFALMQQVVDEMKSEISNEVNTMIKQQEGIDGNRYVELTKGGTDEADLKAAGAKDFEIQFVQLVEEEKEERIDAIKSVTKILATKMLSGRGKTYKAIKQALASNSDVKSRYQAIASDLKMGE